MTSKNDENFIKNTQHITQQDIKFIMSEYGINEDTKVDNYTVRNASDHMLGFLAEYWKVKVLLTNRKAYNFFVKAISRTNVAKAEMVREMKLFEKEMQFYLKSNKIMNIPGIDPWSSRLVTVLRDTLVFEDLNTMQYKIKSKFERFDMEHTLQALKTLARFHSSTIIYEERKRKENRSLYKITDDYEDVLHKGGYHIACEWYIQCMTGALDALKMFSKYNKSELDVIERQWYDIWNSALDINDRESNQRKVICHRDLWNNNLMFHYEKGCHNELIPDNCLLVDFQAVRYQPPASDIMLLLCCNLDPKFREDNMALFLNFYYKELKKLLANYKIQVNKVMTEEEFLSSAKEQIKWGLIICACLMPQFWIDDDITTTIFSDNKQFEDILCKNKGDFIKKMMQANADYKQKVMEIFEEIADRFCFR